MTIDPTPGRPERALELALVVVDLRLLGGLLDRLPSPSDVLQVERSRPHAFVGPHHDQRLLADGPADLVVLGDDDLLGRDLALVGVSFPLMVPAVGDLDRFVYAEAGSERRSRAKKFVERVRAKCNRPADLARRGWGAKVERLASPPAPRRSAKWRTIRGRRKIRVLLVLPGFRSQLPPLLLARAGPVLGEDLSLDQSMRQTWPMRIQTRGRRRSGGVAQRQMVEVVDAGVETRVCGVSQETETLPDRGDDRTRAAGV